MKDESLTSSLESISLNPNSNNNKDIEGIALLREIFPNDSTEELERLHWERIAKRSGGFSCRLVRDGQLGFGLTLGEDGNSFIRVHAVQGPALQAGVRVGNILVGINGRLLEQIPSSKLHSAVAMLRCESSVVLDFQRMPVPSNRGTIIPTTPPRLLELPTTLALLDETNLDDSSLLQHPDFGTCLYQSTPMTNMNPGGIHAFAAALAHDGVLSSTREQLDLSRTLAILDERTREWETNSVLRLEDAVIPLLGIRQALTVRIVNSFAQDKDIAYTIWVSDVDTGTEWYAPLRYWRDFVELRQTILALDPTIAQLPFPKQSYFTSPLKNPDPKDKSRLLEAFLRSACQLIHTSPLHESSGEVAVHVQSFLGCDGVGIEGHGDDLEDESLVRTKLEQGLQKYTHRLLSLTPIENMVNQFVLSIIARKPSREEMEVLQAQGVVQAKALEDLQRVQVFLDDLQNLLLESCDSEYRSIAERDEYERLKILETDGWKTLVRDAVREQVELEVYVPLRSVISRWLVTGWKHQDMECDLKIKQLRKYLQVKPEWQGVCNILRHGMTHTLPCAKLRATVDAAREISRIAGSLGADDFLPIFIYCIVQAQVERPCALVVLLGALCHQSSRIGEIGYYFASFQAAIAHIQQVDVSRDADLLSFLGNE